jgi:hypothetical protein
MLYRKAGSKKRKNIFFSLKTKNKEVMRKERFVSIKAIPGPGD